MLSVVRVHLPTDIPIVGCELSAYVFLRRGDSSLSPEDVTEASSTDGYFLQCRWFRLQSEQKVLVCCIHPSEPATLQCVQCLKAKLPQSKSLHCTQKCFTDSWRHHVIMHQETAEKRENNLEEDDSPFLFNSNPAKSLRSLDGSLSGAATHSANLSNGSIFSSPVRMASHNQNQEAGDVWCEVGQGKTYTPTTEDIGHVLKIECVVIDGSTGRPAAAPYQRLTSRVIPAPSPTPRRLIPVNAVEGTTPVETDGRTSSSGTFTVLSYNVLSDLYATSDMYSYCPPWALAWTYRKQNLLREIVAYHADILCLQEVQSDHYEEFFAPELEKHGYTGVYKKKTGEVYTGSVYVIDGCATFFRRDRFSLVKKYEVEFNKAAQSLSEALVPTTKKVALSRLLKDNVALIVVLEARDTGGFTDSQGTPGKRGQLLCVANTHIHANQELKDVKLWQVHTLLKGLEKIAASADIPMLVAGDFNSIPGSAPHCLLSTGRVDPTHPDLQVDPLNILRPASKLCHSLSLVSAYASFGRMNGLGPTVEKRMRQMDPTTSEPQFTNCTRDFLGTLDYIFYTADSLTVESLLELLDEDSLRKDTALPSPEWSSDHIALLAEFRCKPRIRR
ncbi:carbon catabolite repressor protein 4 homolog 1 isoform X1 [Physcomitrium patens]|uniref:poly(A)-specific ribonuclease n=1 Tax=Physcomitrium patens TaxID=3218 RepID=A9SPE6_PHYPA|nr:carbon catabolite repressor protein 4 homolog 1-like isoform X1 [Physcomitrium patens]XP_024364547.1 carbon catabolite repressor protein 4 homolog 1-like isoform X1 [Physcomitrium patens]XP_024364548.1 carbon catabolite repressor protein 4 homolog 1-like isoform X1 [Physcomitrium patens]PNR28766.1 hypothetical protein PHYPA_029359 [Physcomitrium patens]|eukprot:XP_024364546.1 carbon catabolite repressor protein 4 homolog 1-like isoform X1 [Physcomitrella patens]